jgi:hypothetical protein
MRTQPIQFAAQSYLARSGNASAERLVNLYLERNPEGAKGPVTLYGDPGLKLWATVGDGPCRGLRRMGADLYVVSGNELYAVDSSKVATLVGAVLGSGNVRMTENGAHVAICSTQFAYAANRDELVTMDQQYLNGATFQDGYGIFTQIGAQNLFITALDDMTSIDPLDFTTADAKPDLVVTVASNRREVWVFKAETTEVFINTGASGFPFARAGGGFMERGCLAPGSVVIDGERVYWLGNDKHIYASQGYNPQVISTPAIDMLVAAAGGASTAEAMIYQISGHKFYSLNFSNLTVIYDTTTGLWHERASFGLSRWRANGFAEFDGRLLVGDYANGKIYELDLNTYDEDGDTILRTAVTPPIHAGGEGRVSMPFAFVDFETGVGLVTGQGSTPQCMLDFSDDYGTTWRGQRLATLGALGVRHARATFSNLGAFHNRHLRVTISDPVKVAITGARCGLEAWA